MPIRSSAGSKPRTSWRISTSTPDASTCLRTAVHLGVDLGGLLRVEATPHRDGELTTTSVGSTELGLGDRRGQRGLTLRLGHVAHHDGFPSGHGTQSRRAHGQPVDERRTPATGRQGRLRGVGELREPVPPEQRALLRRAVVDARPVDRRPDLPAGGARRRPGRAASTLRRPARRADRPRAAHRRRGGDGSAARGRTRPAWVWLTRSGELDLHDLDAEWLAAACTAYAEAGVDLTMVVVNRRGWRDPRSGVEPHVGAAARLAAGPSPRCAPARWCASARGTPAACARRAS